MTSPAAQAKEATEQPAPPTAVERADELAWKATGSLYRQPGSHTDSGRYVRAAGLGAYVDGSRWLLKACYDPYVNFTGHAMFRLGLGAKL